MGTYLSEAKTFQFCGAKPLTTYSIYDIFKGDLDLDSQLVKFKEVLEKNFLQEQDLK